jgi:hypothetical protein
MKALCGVAFIVAGCSWGWFLGGFISTTDSYYFSPQDAKHLFGFLGLIAGLFVGAGFGSLAVRYLPPKLFPIPVVVLILGLVPLVIVGVARHADDVLIARTGIEDAKRDKELRADAKRLLDDFSSATGWRETSSYWDSRWYDLAADPDQVQAQLVSLGATDIEAIPNSKTLSMKFPSGAHQAYVQLTPAEGGGSHVMIQY